MEKNIKNITYLHDFIRGSKPKRGIYLVTRQNAVFVSYVVKSTIGAVVKLNGERRGVRGKTPYVKCLTEETVLR